MGNEEGLDRSSALQQTSSMKAERAYAKYEDEFGGGWDEARGGVHEPAHDADVFSGGHEKATTIEGVHRGQSGYGDRLSAASTVAAVENEGSWGVIAAPVNPVLAACEAGIKEQQESVEANHPKHGDPDWLTTKKTYSQGWANANEQSMMRYELEQNSQCTAYNSWVPIANASHTAMAEMVEAARLMGFDPSKDKDAVAFIASIEGSLDMATELVDANVLHGASGATSWSKRADDHTVQSRAQPKLDGTAVGTEVRLLGESYRTLRDAYLDVYRGLVKDQKKIADEKTAETQSKIDSINNVIAFWNGIATFTESTMTHANSAIRAEHKVTTSIGTGKYKAAGMRRDAEKQAQHAEAHPADYESEILVHAKAYEVENHEEYWGKGQASVAASGPQMPVVPAPEELPSLSLSGVVSMGMQLWSQDKMGKLQALLDGERGNSQALQLTADLAETKAAKNKYASAGQAFDERVREMGANTLALRQQDFVDMGAQLDAYASEHQAALVAGGQGNLAPGGGLEIYSTMMAVMGKVEQYRTLSTLARNTFDYEGCVSTARNQQLERSGMKHPAESADKNPSLAYNRPPAVRPMSAEELEVYQRITSAYLRVSQQDAHWSVRLGGVIPRFEQLMMRMAGHGVRGVGRKY